MAEGGDYTSSLGTLKWVLGAGIAKNLMRTRHIRYPPELELSNIQMTDIRDALEKDPLNIYLIKDGLEVFLEHMRKTDEKPVKMAKYKMPSDVPREPRQPGARPRRNIVDGDSDPDDGTNNVYRPRRQPAEANGQSEALNKQQQENRQEIDNFNAERDAPELVRQLLNGLHLTGAEEIVRNEAAGILEQISNQLQPPTGLSVDTGRTSAEPPNVRTSVNISNVRVSTEPGPILVTTRPELIDFPDLTQGQPENLEEDNAQPLPEIGPDAGEFPVELVIEPHVDVAPTVEGAQDNAAHATDAPAEPEPQNDEAVVPDPNVTTAAEPRRRRARGPRQPRQPRTASGEPPDPEYAPPRPRSRSTARGTEGADGQVGQPGQTDNGQVVQVNGGHNDSVPQVFGGEDGQAVLEQPIFEPVPENPPELVANIIPDPQALTADLQNVLNRASVQLIELWPAPVGLPEVELAPVGLPEVELAPAQGNPLPEETHPVEQPVDEPTERPTDQSIIRPDEQPIEIEPMLGAQDFISVYKQTYNLQLLEKCRDIAQACSDNEIVYLDSLNPPPDADGALYREKTLEMFALNDCFQSGYIKFIRNENNELIGYTLRALDDEYVEEQPGFPQSMLNLNCERRLSVDNIPIDVAMNRIELYPADNEQLVRFEGAMDDSETRNETIANMPSAEDELTAGLEAVQFGSESNDDHEGNVFGNGSSTDIDF